MHSNDFAIAISKPRQEARAAEHCGRQGLQVVIPRLRRQHSVRGKVRTTESYLFPSYLFVELTGDHVYGVLRNTLGVSRVLVVGEQPARCRAGVVQELLQRMDADGFVQLPDPPPTPPVVYRSGQPVRVVQAGHALFGRLGVYAGMDARQRVQVLMMFMGRTVPVRLEHSVLAAA